MPNQKTPLSADPTSQLQILYADYYPFGGGHYLVEGITADEAAKS